MSTCAEATMTQSVTWFGSDDRRETLHVYPSRNAAVEIYYYDTIKLLKTPTLAQRYDHEKCHKVTS
jgi:hypothetical protein